MSRSGRKYRDPFNMDARQRKAGQIESDKRHQIEELTQKELDDELQNLWHEEQWHIGEEEYQTFRRRERD